METLTLLCEKGANINTEDIHGAYPIHYAAQLCGPSSESTSSNSRLSLIALRKLLLNGINMDVKDKDGRSPLLWAASAGSTDAILALIHAGANPSPEDKDGLTVLHCAASRGHTDCIQSLVTLCSANVNCTDFNGCTPIFYSVSLGYVESTKMLLILGALPNVKDRKGRTPAFCGAAKGQLESLRP